MDSAESSGHAVTENELTATILKIALASSAVFLQLAWGQAMLFAANKPGASALAGFGLLFMVLLPWLLVWRGRLRAGIWVFLASATLISSTLYWLGHDVFSVSAVLQLGAIIHAAILLGQKGAFGIGSICLGTDLVKLILESGGWMAPLYFPGTVLGSWSLIVLTVIWVSPVLIYVVSSLHRSADQLRAQVGELREANEKLQRSEQLLQSITETAPVGILLFDAGGYCIFANTFATARLGGEIRGCHRDKLPWPVTDFNGVPIPVEQRPFARLNEGGCSVYGARMIVERPPGRHMYFSVSAAPLPNGTEGKGIVVAFEDVTSHVDIDRRHVQAQRLASMGELAGWVAHDFNNFLTVIHGDSQLALEKAPQDAGLRARLERIYQTSERAAAVCKRLLTFARREDAIAQPLSLTTLVNENAELLKGLVPANVNLVFKLERDLRTIAGDASLLTQVLINLVANARDAMSNGGTITISTANDSPRSGVLLLVEDGGTGINLATLPSIFEPRFTTKPEGRGTGLGLAIVYGIVDQFGGWIRVESEPGQGTRFLIRFPSPEVESKSSAA